MNSRGHQHITLTHHSTRSRHTTILSPTKVQSQLHWNTISRHNPQRHRFPSSMMVSGERRREGLVRGKEKREGGEGAEVEIYGALSRSVGTTLRHPEPRDSRTQLFE
ncbi:hypothetical protein E2C01_058276 [Portunus trituberculatus]|uniref:Uncharacterized protein n=1 Tax=Portunus trituberculatus TaxID=210409 RepID=A0A5B7H3B0_PORTR|nr:hypothetical protein [Portunus trituberculatus]